MKKGRVFAAVGVLLVLVLAASLLAGCDLGKKKVKDEAATHSLSELMPEAKASAKLKLSEILELRGYNSIGTPDALGLVVASKTTSEEVEDEDGGYPTTVYTTDWMLYDLVLGNVVRKTTDIPILKKTTGLYYIEETDTSGEDSVDKTTFFGRGGFSETVEGAPAYDGDWDEIVVLSGDRRLYVDPNGALAYEDNPVKNVLTWQKIDHSYLRKAGDLRYGLDDDDGILDIADPKTGEMKRVCLDPIFGVPENAEENYDWTVGEKIFVQYVTELPKDAQSYDFYDSDGKYNVDTYVYDMRTGDHSVLGDFNFLVDFAVDGKDYAILDGKYFENGHCRKSDVVQSFDKDGKVFVDLQKVWPGMTGCIPGFYGMTVCFDGTDTYRCYSGDNLIREIAGDYGVGQMNGQFIVTPNALYGLDYEKLDDFPEGETYHSVYGDTVITKKIVEAEEQYFARTYKITVDKDGKINAEKGDRHERVRLVPSYLVGGYTYYLEEAGTGLYDFYEGTRTESIGRLDASDISGMNFNSFKVPGEESVVFVKGLYREVVPAGTSGEDGSPTPPEYIFVYYVIKAA